MTRSDINQLDKCHTMMARLQLLANSDSSLRLLWLRNFERVYKMRKKILMNIYEKRLRKLNNLQKYEKN